MSDRLSEPTGAVGPGRAPSEPNRGGPVDVPAPNESSCLLGAPDPRKGGRRATMLGGAAAGLEAVLGTGASSPRANMARPGPALRRTRTLSPPDRRGARREQTAPRSGVGPVGPASHSRPGGSPMDVLHDRCAGLDVHKKTVVACVRSVGPDGSVEVPHLRHHDRRPARAGRLARRRGGPPRRHGIHRRLLEADLAPARGPLRADAGQRRPHQAGPRAEDRRQGRRVDRPAAPARPALAQLRAAPAGPRAPRPDPAAGPVDRRQGGGRQSGP